VPSVRRRADVVFTRARVAVFVDGCYWHGCPLHCRLSGQNVKWWRAKIDGNRRRDADTDLALEREGWRVVRVWTHEDVTAVADRVEALVRKLAA